MMQHCHNNGGGGGGGTTAEVYIEETDEEPCDERVFPTLSLKLVDDDLGCAADIDQATDSETPTEFPSESCTPTLRLELRTDHSRQSDDNCYEQIWRDGNLHWGERQGDGWIELWQTQEGLSSRFGTKRGRDKKQGRDWQERWEQNGDVTRIEKRITQRHEDREVERWIERLDITDKTVRETCVGENKLTRRQWRLQATYRVDGANIRRLQSKQLEEIWSEEHSPADSTDDQKIRKRRVETTCVQPGGRVLHTHISETECDGDFTSEADRYEDCLTGSKWGSESRRSDTETCVKDWNTNATTGSHEHRETIYRPRKTSGVVVSYNPLTNETYRENWGKEKIDDTHQNEWSSKWRQRNSDPWGDYTEKIEVLDLETDAVIQEEQRNEKWWYENNERFSEQWTVIEERKDNKTTKIVKNGHNKYGDTAREYWEEVYEVVETTGERTPTLQHKRVEKVNPKLRSIEEVDADEEHHVVEDKEIGQTDVWHINKRTGAKWGNKDGKNAEGVLWHERWSESDSEKWLEKSWKNDEREWGERSGSRGARESWNEKWASDASTRWQERSETDAEGNVINRRTGARFKEDGSEREKYLDAHGETLAGERWAHKQGFDEFSGDWEEKWNERKGYKSASKRGHDHVRGDRWFEAWSEHYDSSTGARTKQTAYKEGVNAAGEKWMETWTEEGAEKYAQKMGRNNEQSWREEWREENDGGMWCKKWASNGKDKWGETWTDDSSGYQRGCSWRNDQVVHRWERPLD